MPTSCPGPTPCPWEGRALQAFARADRPALRQIFQKQAAAQAARIREFGLNASSTLFKRLRAEGMTSTALGLDFTKLQRTLYPRRPEGVLAYEPVTLGLKLVVFPTFITGKPYDRGINEALWQYDQVARGRCAMPGLDGARRSSLQRMKQRLARDGLLKISDWRDWGVDLQALSAQADAALQKSEAALEKKSSHRRTSPLHLPAVEPLLRNESVAELLRDYLGGPVRYDGLVTLELGEGLTEANYVSGTWHHDRCGRRLKLFIFLHDVLPDGRPTQVARGSANIVYYSNSEPWALMSRYSDSYVRANYGVTNMTGPAGGGFVFDTNSLHRGVIDGVRSRRTVVLEFHGHGKIPQAFNFKHNACPSIKTATRSWQRGEPGFALYPPEPLKRARSAPGSFPAAAVVGSSALGLPDDGAPIDSPKSGGDATLHLRRPHPRRQFTNSTAQEAPRSRNGAPWRAPKPNARAAAAGGAAHAQEPLVQRAVRAAEERVDSELERQRAGFERQIAELRSQLEGSGPGVT